MRLFPFPFQRRTGPRVSAYHDFSLIPVAPPRRACGPCNSSVLLLPSHPPAIQYGVSIPTLSSGVVPRVLHPLLTDCVKGHLHAEHDFLSLERPRLSPSSHASHPSLLIVRVAKRMGEATLCFHMTLEIVASPACPFFSRVNQRRGRPVFLPPCSHMTFLAVSFATGRRPGHPGGDAGSGDERHPVSCQAYVYRPTAGPPMEEMEGGRAM